MVGTGHRKSRVLIRKVSCFSSHVLQIAIRFRIPFVAFIVFAALFNLFFMSGNYDRKLLASSDGFIFYYPVLASWSIWNDLILSGYPSFADSQFLTWYPIRFAGLSYNAVVISAYILASFFTYGLVRRLTGSHLAGLLSGLIYGMGGFMTAHLGHLTIIHTAAWIPLILLAIHHVTARPTAGWWVIGSIGIACACLAGHPQVLVYGLLLAGALAAHRMACAPRKYPEFVFRVAAASVGMLALGFAAAAVQILPLIELSGLSIRQGVSGQQEWTFEKFTSYSLPPNQLLMILFPNLFGSDPPPEGSYLQLKPYFGAWNLTELACYFSVISFLLAALALSARRNRPEVAFWFAVAVLSCLYALGGATPLAGLVFQLPVLGKFGEPARAVLILDLAMAVLAGIGCAELLNRQVSRRQLILSCSVFAGILVAGVVGAYRAYPRLLIMAGAEISLPSLTNNPAVYEPLILGCIGLAAVLLVARGRRRAGVFLLFATVTADLGSFGYYGGGRSSGVDPSAVQMNSEWRMVRDDLVSNRGRLLPIGSDGAQHNPGTQILNLIYGIPSASGYGPLMLDTYAAATGMSPSGYLAPPPPNSPLFKLLDVRWVDETGTSHPLRFQLGRKCGPINDPGPLHIRLPSAIRATRIQIVSKMSCSTEIVQDQEAMRISLQDESSGRVSYFSVPVLAGRDTAEWAIDRPDVAKVIQHGRATIFRSFAAGGHMGHTYEANLPIWLSGRPLDIRDLAFEWISNTGSIDVLEATLIDDTNNARYTLPASVLSYGDRENWSAPLMPSSNDRLIKYKNGLGLAWLVGGVRTEARQAIANAVRTGRLSDNSTFDPERLALLEDPAPALPTEPSIVQGGHVDIVTRQPEHWIIDISAPAPAFLSISQTDYPGWYATVNGKTARLYRTNYAFQGIAVPAGRSRVELTFQSRTLLYGAGISALAVLLGFCVAGRSLYGRSRIASETRPLLFH